MVKKRLKKIKSKLFEFTKEDFSRENFIEGGIIRPAVLMSAFIMFMIAMFLLLLGAKGDTVAMKWGGSMIIFSFILNLEAIYMSLTDTSSIFRTLNLAFKIVLFIAEIYIFNWILIETGMSSLFPMM